MMTPLSYLLLLMTWSLTLTASLVEGQTVSYDEDLLMKYARVTQQLRHKMRVFQEDFLEKDEECQTRQNAVQSQMNEEMEAAQSLLIPAWERVDALQRSLGTKLAPALLLYSPQPVTDLTILMFSDVTLDHGFGYNEEMGSVSIKKAGLYLMEIKVQSSDYKSLNVKVYVQRSDGSQKHTFSYLIDWEISPFFQPLELEIGDVVLTTSLTDGGMFNSLSSLTGGPATQFSLRYVGKP